jgi:hypothetical protein
MTRRTLATIAMLTVTLATISSDAFAGCGGGRYGGFGGYGYSHRVNHVVRPVTHYVRPVTVVNPIVHQAPQVAVAPPIVEAPDAPVVPSGSSLTLPANFLGDIPGDVFMVFNDIKLPVQVHNWTSTGVTITLPPMAIKESVLIRLDIVLPDGRLGHKQMLRVTKPAEVVLHPTAPTSPLPTQAALQSQTAATAALLGR